MKKILSLTLATLMVLLIGLYGCIPTDNSSATADESYVTEAASTTFSETTSTVQTEGTTKAEETTVAETTVASTTTAEKTESTKLASDKSDNDDKPASSGGNKTVYVSKVSLSKSSMTLNVGDSDSFKVTLSPSNANNRTYSVSTSNSNASVSYSGNTVTVTGKYEGKCTVTVTSSNGKTAVCNVTVKKKTPAVITDDTVLPHKELATATNMQRLCDTITTYFVQNGMTEKPSLNTSNSGWYLCYDGTYEMTASRSYNEMKELVMSFIIEQVDGILVGMHGIAYNEVHFHCYYDMQANGEYAIYFCYA